MVDVLLVVAVAVGWFQVPLRGSFALLLLDVSRLPADRVGFGIIRLDRVDGDAAGRMMTTAFFFLVPMIFLLGFVFPIENMPALVQPVTYLIPSVILPRDSAWNLPQGRRAGRAVAGCAGAVRVGCRDSDPRDPSIQQQAARLGRFAVLGVAKLNVVSAFRGTVSV